MEDVNLEYLVRLWVSPKPLAYARSFYGIVDLLAILPTYLALLVANAQYLLVIRILRVLRIFRVLKLVRYLSEANLLLRSLLAAAQGTGVLFLCRGADRPVRLPDVPDRGAGERLYQYLSLSI